MTRRLVLSYLGVTVVVLLLLEVPFGIFYARRELDRFTAAIDRDASVLAAVYEDALETGTALDPAPAASYERKTGARVVVVDPEGTSLIDTDQPTPRDLSTRPEIAEALDGRRDTGTRVSNTLDTRLLFVAVPVSSGGRIHGALRLTLDTRDVDARIWRFWIGLGTIALVVIAAILLIGWLAARSVGEPLRRLNETAGRFGRGELDVRPSTDRGPPEVRELASTMAVMATDLAGMIEEKRAFVADASHQLRTPLTGLRLRLENLQLGLDEDDSAEVDAAIDEIDRLSSLVDDLLRLARADRNTDVEPQDLTTIAAERIDIWSAVADTSGVSLGFDADDAHVEGVAVTGAVEQILDNLLDNAIGLTPDGSTVTVTVGRDGDSAVLIVADEGPGLDDDDKVQATRRFWRGDPTRPGSGLGLAIVEELVTASRGTLQLTDCAAGGLTVTIRFRTAS